MTNYADFAYYTSTYKGAVLDTASFDLWARKATLIIRQHTFNRVRDSNIPDAVKMCCCELAEAEYSHDKTEDSGNVASEKVGEYSVSYVDKEKQESIYQAEVGRIISLWLLDTGLLYRGICR